MIPTICRPVLALPPSPAAMMIPSAEAMDRSAVIVISRGLARSVRALARKCVSGRPRGPARRPPATA